MGIIDETVFLKKGAHSAGVPLQYSGTAGRVENCQVRVFLAYAGARGYTLLDAELFLPKGWTREPARLQGVGLALDTPFATKPQLSQWLLARAQAAGVSLRCSCAQPEQWQAYLVWGRPATCPPWSGLPAAAGASSRPSGWPSRRWA